MSTPTPLQRRAHSLAAEGQDIWDISLTLGITVAAANQALQDYAASVPDPAIEIQRAAQSALLDSYIQRVTQALLADPPTITLKEAVVCIVNLSTRKSRLLGLDSPTKQSIEHSLTSTPPASIDEEVRKLAIELGFSS